MADYQTRLVNEIAMIKQMGFAGYFLIVWDFVRYAKEHSIPVGPGRGSSAGSLVAYCLQITDVDPLQYDLIFERFLNPGRVSMPDIDIDFCVRGRGRRDQPCGRALRPRLSLPNHHLRNSGLAGRYQGCRAGHLEMPYSEVDRIAKMIPPPVRGQKREPHPGAGTSA